MLLNMTANKTAAADVTAVASAIFVVHAEDSEDEDIPETIEEVIQVLLTAIRDKDTIVRWSGAKVL